MYSLMDWHNNIICTCLMSMRSLEVTYLFKLSQCHYETNNKWFDLNQVAFVDIWTMINPSLVVESVFLLVRVVNKKR